MTPRQEYLEKLRSFLGGRRQAYQQTFKGPYGNDVLKDLAWFCRAHESTFDENDRAHAVAEGRREVWLRIQKHLHLSPQQLWEFYQGKTD